MKRAKPRLPLDIADAEADTLLLRVSGMSGLHHWKRLWICVYTTDQVMTLWVLEEKLMMHDL